jgi:methylglyoxal reductase
LKYMEIGKSGITASVLALGSWEMGGGSAWGGNDDELSVRIIHEALDRGINLIDTAPLYGTGHSEEIVGRALKGRRSACAVSTKCGLNWRPDGGTKELDRDGRSVYKDLSPRAIREDLTASLRRLGVDTIDIYFTHRQPEPAMIAEVAGTLEALKREGLIRAIGISNSNAGHFREYVKHCRVDVVQEKLNVLDRANEKEYLPLCERHGATFQAYSSLARGLLTGKLGMDYAAAGDAQRTFAWFEPKRRKHVIDMLDGWKDLCRKLDCSLANLALAFVLSRSESVNVLFGARRMESLVDSLKTIDVSLSPQDVSRMKNDADNVIAACGA